MGLSNWFKEEILNAAPFEPWEKGQETTFQHFLKNHTLHDEDIVHLGTNFKDQILVTTLGGPWNKCAIKDEKVWESEILYLVFILKTYSTNSTFDLSLIGRVESIDLNENQKEKVISFLDEFNLLPKNKIWLALEKDLTHTKFLFGNSWQLSILHEQIIEVKCYDARGKRHFLTRIK
jgi:hypothetical protein